MARDPHLPAAGNPPGRQRALLPRPRHEGHYIPFALGPLGRVSRFFEDRLPPVPPIHHLIDGSGIFHTQLAHHVHKLSPSLKYVNITH